MRRLSARMAFADIDFAKDEVLDMFKQFIGDEVNIISPSWPVTPFVTENELVLYGENDYLRTVLNQIYHNDYLGHRLYSAEAYDKWYDFDIKKRERIVRVDRRYERSLSCIVKLTKYPNINAVVLPADPSIDIIYGFDESLSGHMLYEKLRKEFESEQSVIFSFMSCANLSTGKPLRFPQIAQKPTLKCLEGGLSKN